MPPNLNFTPVKRKRDRKDTNKRVGDAAYDHARLSLPKRVKEAEERARKRADSLTFEAEAETDGWQDEDGPGSEAHLQLSQGYEASLGSDDGEDERPIIDTPISTKPRRTQPNAYTENLYRDWRELIPHLVEPLAMFQKNSALDVGSQPLLCKAPACTRIHERRDILCLYWNYFETQSFECCPSHSQSLPITLIGAGLFPREPRVAVSIDLLNLYLSLLEHSGASNTAFCSALQDFYVSRGFWMRDAKGVPIQEPFRRGFGCAAKWYGCVKMALEEKIDVMLSNARAKIPDTFKGVPNEMPQPCRSAEVDTGVEYIPPATGDRITVSLARGQCSELLQQRCQA
ncbi:uncharacterized protein ARMOST_14783 [Armillaria ostoyae]|uniref:CxC1-like cysteine cluster associated with KDZ transposases domain-containing protein n=1 Tax=Armillaria ostoyae TaxID=47428 RepID=A0A284RRK0_ARMOS|nr:uncharacterized protein ARMOST_14783 [Armillaria ostoyae]